MRMCRYRRAGGEAGPLPPVLRRGGHRARRPRVPRLPRPGAHARRGEEGRRRGRLRQGGAQRQKVGQKKPALFKLSREIS